MECIRDDFEQDCQPNKKKLIDVSKMQVNEDGESRPPPAAANNEEEQQQRPPAQNMD